MRHRISYIFGSGLWIIIINIILIVLLFYKSIKDNNDYFMNYPEQVDTNKVVKTNIDTSQANESYAIILNYIKKYPEKSYAFINDIRNRFFQTDCSIKNTIDYNNLTNNVPMLFN